MKPLAKKLMALGRTIGPYLAIELVMPGGSLIAVLLWLYRISPRATFEFPGEAVARPMSFRSHGGSTHEAGIAPARTSETQL